MRLFASRHGWAPFHPACPPKHEIPDSLVGSTAAHALEHGPDLRENIERPVSLLGQINRLSRPKQPLDETVDLLPSDAGNVFEPLSGLRDIKPGQAKGMLAVLMSGEPIPEPHHQGTDQFVCGLQIREFGKLATPKG